MSLTTSQPKKSRFKFKSGDWLMQFLLIGVGLVVAAPIFLAIFSSFKLPTDITNYPPTLLPEVWTFDNYITAWTSKPFYRFFLNSIIQTGVIVVFQVTFSILAAYAFAVLEFPGRDLLFYLILGSLMVPFQLTFIPNFSTDQPMGLGQYLHGFNRTIPGQCLWRVFAAAVFPDSSQRFS